MSKCNPESKVFTGLNMETFKKKGLILLIDDPETMWAVINVGGTYSIMAKGKHGTMYFCGTIKEFKDLLVSGDEVEA